MKAQPKGLQLFYFAALIVVFLFYTGCTFEYGATSGLGSSSTGTATEYRTGSQGLYLNFYPSNSYTYYEGDQLSLLLDVYNKGAYDVENGRLIVSGFDAKYFGNVYFDGANEYDVLNVPGKDEYDPTGSIPQIYEITSDTILLPQNVEKFSQTVLVTACYEYVTEATAEICVDPDPTGRRIENKVCQLQARNYGAQGHPVVINSITPTVGNSLDRDNKEIRFRISYSNAGGGIIFDPDIANGDFDECESGFDNRDIGVVNFYAWLSGTPLECEPENPQKMVSGSSGTVVCSCDSGCVTDSAYWTVLEMEIDYGYMHSLSQPITIYKG